jgi:hypothetical protein
MFAELLSLEVPSGSHSYIVLTVGEDAFLESLTAFDKLCQEAESAQYTYDLLSQSLEMGYQSCCRRGCASM